jgi:hypothetical protein
VTDPSPKRAIESFMPAPLDDTAVALTQAVASSAVALRLLVALQQAASRDVKAMEALRIAVCEFTTALREAGTTPERVLVTLKTVINQRTLPQFLSRNSDRNGTWLRESVSTWCIKSYFNDGIPCV